MSPRSSLCCALLVNAVAGTTRRPPPVFLATITSADHAAGYRRQLHAAVLVGEVAVPPAMSGGGSGRSYSNRWKFSAVPPSSAAMITTGYVTSVSPSKWGNMNTRSVSRTRSHTNRIHPLPAPRWSSNEQTNDRGRRSRQPSFYNASPIAVASGNSRSYSTRRIGSSSTPVVANAAAGPMGVSETGTVEELLQDAVPAAVDGRDGGEKMMKVTLLSGFLGAGKTTLMRNALRQAKAEGLSVAIIVNDMADVNIDAQLLASGVDTSIRSLSEQGGVIAMQDGCICCTIREDLLLEVENLAREGRHDHLIIESTGISDPTPVAEGFSSIAADATPLGVSTGDDGDGGNIDKYGGRRQFSLDTLVTVVDSTSFMDEIRRADDLEERGIEAEEGDTRTVADLLMAQVEFANVILLNKADLVAKSEDMATLEAVVRKLNPAARVLRTVSSTVGLAEVVGTGEFDLEKASQAAGWVQTLNNGTTAAAHHHEHSQHEEGGQGEGRRNRSGHRYGIDSFTFRAERPFHPERLMDFVMEHLPTVIRSKGFLWLATRPDTTGVWNQAGGSFATEYGGTWNDDDDGFSYDDDVDSNNLTVEYGDDDQDSSDRDSSGDNCGRNELVFIGLVADMKEEVLTAALRRCLLTDEEMERGAAAWKTEMNDPFPPWEEEEYE